MKIEILNTGSELLLGRVLNTHQQWICRQMADLGYEVDRQVAVPDTAPEIVSAAREALSRSDLVIVTGGLGPTSDDRTRDLVAEMLGRKLHLDTRVVEKILSYFAGRKRPAPPGTEIQAMVPEGAVVLDNDFGTAPGLALQVEPGRFRTSASWLIMLPGPPRELRPMFTNRVIPLLRQQFPLTEECVCRTLKTTGMGESWLQEKVAGPLKHLTDAGLDLGYCARIGEVDVRFVGRGPKGSDMVNQAEAVVRGLIGEYVFGLDDDQLEHVIVQLLRKKGKKVALAESCTGGYIANRITNVSGASEVFLAGLVTYSNEAKQTFLGVKAFTLEANGAVSEPTAREMAEGARERTGADYAISVTGIAGPTGGTPEKPVGTVFIGLATPEGTQVKKMINAFDRETFKYVTSEQALELLRKALIRSGQ